MSSRIRLTSQQQAIVAHDRGPALVYAVAGAGKTTAMVHRIARLVQDDVFPPHQILATSFNRDANRQIERALATWPACRDVRVRTLHALGFTVIKLAVERGYLPRYELGRGQTGAAGVERYILARTLEVVRGARGPLAAQIDALDGDHFLAFVQRAKANLVLVDPHRDLPRRLRRTLQPVQPPRDRPWYSELYAHFEATRQADHLLTFDDMLATGWEVLARCPDILDLVQRRHRCVLVDEFQDVNRAQTELLDLITAPTRDLMVIGDDDQTIYEWRGASPFFIRSFRKRYGAAVYFMTDNFRSRAVHLALANQVIRHDQQRQAKYLQLTRGFGGECVVRVLADEDGVAESIAHTALHLHHAGTTYAEMAVLVRVYGQTPAIEQALRRAGIPYTVLAETDARRETTGVTITSIYRAKGLEWPAVFVPGCQAGLLPYAQTDNLDEERRLFYVAITRAQERLFLYAQQDRPLSPYLRDAHHDAVLAAVAQVEAALARPPATWHAAEYLAVAVNAKRLYLHEYFVHWWRAAPATRQDVATAVLRFYATLRRIRRFRQFDLRREDAHLWRTVAGTRVDETPLTDPLLLAELARLTGTRRLA